MIHAIFLGPDFRVVMGEGERMGRHVYLGDDIDAILLCQFLEFDELSLGVTAILRRESRISVAFQTESRLGLCPIITEKLSESVIIQMNLQGVHLVIRHHLDQRAQIRHRDELSSAIHHEASQPVGRLILSRAFRQHETSRALLLRKLQHGAGTPYQSFYRRSRDGGYVADGEAIAFLAEQSG